MKMKLKGAVLLLSFICTFSATSQAIPGVYGSGSLACAQGAGDLQPRGGPVIWPWGAEVSINMGNLQGIWRMMTAGCNDMYVVKVLREAPSENMVSITQYDPNTCRVIASGKGYHQGRVIRAIVSGSGRSYELTIHAFRNVDIRPGGVGGIQANGIESTIYVMKKYAIGGGTPRTTVSQIDRLDKNTTMSCE